jgi:2-methylcitrate dehydratase PrpD
MPDYLDQLAEFLAGCGFDDLPEPAVARARLVIADTVAAIAAGALVVDTPPGRQYGLTSAGSTVDIIIHSINIGMVAVRSNANEARWIVASSHRAQSGRKI